jgi:two-component system chemotaxis response regulator CheY
MAVSKDINILVVDDYSSMVRIIRNLLEQLGFRNIDEATDGRRAWELLESKSYGLVLSDWNMQPVTGLELLKQVRKNERTKSVPFVMITAEARSENVAAARQAGVNNYVVKPFTLAVLRQKLHAVLGAFE